MVNLVSLRKTIEREECESYLVCFVHTMRNYRTGCLLLLTPAVSSKCCFIVLLQASQLEIRRAYKRLVLQTHPDRTSGNPVTTESFLSIQQAYEVLSHEESRAEYDLLFLCQLHVEVGALVKLTVVYQCTELRD